jgi:uncharacterized Zn finger protein (UPF0148 family)
MLHKTNKKKFWNEKEEPKKRNENFPKTQASRIIKNKHKTHAQHDDRPRSTIASPDRFFFFIVVIFSEESSTSSISSTTRWRRKKRRSRRRRHHHQQQQKKESNENNARRATHRVSRDFSPRVAIVRLILRLRGRSFRDGGGIRNLPFRRRRRYRRVGFARRFRLPREQEEF